MDIHTERVVSTNHSRTVTAAAATAATLLLVASGEDSACGSVSLSVQASLRGTGVSRLAVEVTGPGIDAPVGAQMAVDPADGSAECTLRVPAGPARTITLRAGGGGAGALVGATTVELRDAMAALRTVPLAAGQAPPNADGGRP